MVASYLFIFVCMSPMSEIRVAIRKILTYITLLCLVHSIHLLLCNFNFNTTIYLIDICSSFCLAPNISSSREMEENLKEEPPAKKARVTDPEVKSEITNAAIAAADEQKEGLGTLTTMADLPHRKLPPELNCQIFYCLNLLTRRKFIFGLGWDFYAMFRQILLKKSKRICNPVGNVWTRSNGDANVTISEDGLIASNNINGFQNIYAEKGFPISVADCRMDDFPGTICYYYEVKTLSERCLVGFQNGEVNFGIVLADTPNTYTNATISTDGRVGDFRFAELPVGARSESNAQGNVYGCGILMDPDNNLTTFFTLNGILLGKQNQINPTVDRLCPAVTIFVNQNLLTFEANFGNDKDKPFAYDINKCPGMGLDCMPTI